MIWMYFNQETVKLIYPSFLHYEPDVSFLSLKDMKILGTGSQAMNN